MNVQAIIKNLSKTKVDYKANLSEQMHGRSKIYRLCQSYQAFILTAHSW